ADSFQSDIFPPAPSADPSLSASEFFAGKTVPRNVVDLSSGTTYASSATATVTLSAPPPTPGALASPSLARANSYSSPAPSPVVAKQEPPTPVVRAASPEPPAPAPAAAVVEPKRSQTTPGSDGQSSLLKEENARLTSELREAREKIRNLE
ncbi:hypothetical protein H0H93_003346, partial [Arthromyces matolae]